MTIRTLLNVATFQFYVHFDDDLMMDTMHGAEEVYSSKHILSISRVLSFCMLNALWCLLSHKKRHSIYVMYYFSIYFINTVYAQAFCLMFLLIITISATFWNMTTVINDAADVFLWCYFALILYFTVAVLSFPLCDFYYVWLPLIDF